jgi:hypothetical protein
MLTYALVCSRMLTYAHVCSRMLTYAHVCSRMLMYAHACRRMLTYAHACSCMLTYAHVCSRLLTYSRVCRRMPTSSDYREALAQLQSSMQGPDSHRTNPDPRWKEPLWMHVRFTPLKHQVCPLEYLNRASIEA